MRPKGRAPKKHTASDGSESWKVRYRSAAGTEKSETFYDEDSAAEFSKLLAALGPTRAIAYIDEREKAEGGERGQAITVDDLFQQWIEWKGRRRKDGSFRNGIRSERTLLDYRRMYAGHIKPKFAAIPANLLSPIDVQDWVDNLDLAPKTIADQHSLLHAMYKWGIHPTRALVINDPCADTQLPKRRRKQPKGLRPAEWLILHAAAVEVDPDAADLLLGLASTGWRFSEVAAVQVMAVDHWLDDDGTSWTYLTMNRILRREGNHFVFIDDGKSEAATRRVRIVGPGEAMLLRRIHGKKPTDLIFTTKQGGRWWYNSFHKRVWHRPEHDDAPRKKRILEVAAKNGLERPDITLHWLRHTHVGMLILAGEPLTAIQRRLGHASIKTTSDTYGRMIEDASDAGLDKVALMLGGAPKPRESRGLAPSSPPEPGSQTP